MKEQEKAKKSKKKDKNKKKNIKPKKQKTFQTDLTKKSFDLSDDKHFLLGNIYQKYSNADNFSLSMFNELVEVIEEKLLKDHRQRSPRKNEHVVGNDVETLKSAVHNDQIGSLLDMYKADISRRTEKYRNLIRTIYEKQVAKANRLMFNAIDQLEKTTACSDYNNMHNIHKGKYAYDLSDSINCNHHSHTHLQKIKKAFHASLNNIEQMSLGETKQNNNNLINEIEHLKSDLKQKNTIIFYLIKRKENSKREKHILMREIKQIKEKLKKLSTRLE